MYMRVGSKWVYTASEWVSRIYVYNMWWAEANNLERVPSGLYLKIYCFL